MLNLRNQLHSILTQALFQFQHHVQSGVSFEPILVKESDHSTKASPDSEVLVTGMVSNMNYAVTIPGPILGNSRVTFILENNSRLDIDPKFEDIFWLTEFVDHINKTKKVDDDYYFD